MTVDVSSFGGGIPPEFDFDSQSGVLFLLRAIRASDIPSADKNTLKDLVFHYNTGGKDSNTKEKLISLLNAMAITPQTVLLEVKKVTETPVVTQSQTMSVPGLSGFPGSRPTPMFAAVTTPKPAAPVKLIVKSPVTQSVNAQTSVTSISVTPATVAKVAPPVPPVVEFKQTKPVTYIPQQPVVEKITPVVPVPNKINSTISAPNIVPQNITPEQVVPPQPVSEPVIANNNGGSVAKVTVPVSSSVPAPSLDVDPSVSAERMERIRIIKSDVNARIGNPVNLVDVDNVLGREYMSALLEAMKLLSSASEIESENAMSRLETVYTKVIALLESKDKVATSVMSAAPLTVVDPVATPEVPPASQLSESVIAPVVSVPVPNPTKPNIPVPIVPVDVVVRSKVTDRPVSQMVNPQTWGDADSVGSLTPSLQVQSPKDSVASVQQVTNVQPEPQSETVPRLEVVSPVAPVYHPEVTQSVSQVTPLRAITELPTAAEVSLIESKGADPLYTKDVDAGLEQLLGEWSLFKKSGLFGTGPKGREHPLYLKIASLQVPLILSGRFEGSTQEIKQSITDYMNGWRYEQGIVYEANETFDQYLRRVIRHIIDLQKTKRRS